MSEPSQTASLLDRADPVLHWSVHDDRIDARSEAYAIPTPGGLVLVDPLPLAEKHLRTFSPVLAIVLTIQSHQRAAWRYRARFGAPVFAPRRAAGLEEEPEAFYDDGDPLPGGLRAIHAPGPCDASFVLRKEDDGSLFLGDLLVRENGGLVFVEPQWMDDPAAARASVRRILGLGVPIGELLPGHGAPLRHGDARAHLLSALAADAAWDIP